MKKFLLSFLLLFTFSFAMFAVPAVTKGTNSEGEETLTISFTASTTFPTSGQTVTSFTADGLEFTGNKLTWQKSKENSYLAFAKDANAGLTFPDFGKPVKSVKFAWKNTAKSKFTLTAGNTSVTFGGNTTTDQNKWGTDGTYTVEIPEADQNSAISVKTANTANQGGIGSFVITFAKGEDGPKEANAKFENITCKTGDLRDIVYTPADLTGISYTSAPEGIVSIADGKVTALAEGEATVTASWSEGTYKAGSATFTVTVEGKVSAPVIAPEAAEVTVKDEISISAIDGAALSYAVVATGDAEPTEFLAYTEPFTLKEGGWTVYAKSTLDGESKTISKAYTVSKLEAGLEYTERDFVAYVSEGFTAPQIVNPNNLPLTYSSDNNDVATVDAETGEVTLSGVEGVAQIKAQFKGDDTYKASERTYNLTVLAERPSDATFNFNQDQAYGLPNHSSNDGGSTYEHGQKVITEGEVTLTINEGDKGGTNTNATGGYRLWKVTNNYELRLHKNATLTFSVGAEYVITKIEFGQNTANVMIEPGEAAKTSYTTWEPAEGVMTNTVTLTRKDTSGNTPFKTIKVTYSKYPAPAVPAVMIGGEVVEGDSYAIEVNEEKDYEVSFAEVGADEAIYYKWEETVATYAAEEGFTKYDAPFTVNKSGTLKYYVENEALGTKSDVRTVTVSIATGIEGIEGEAADAEYFDLEGRKVSGELEKGIYIRRAAGKVEKVIVK